MCEPWSVLDPSPFTRGLHEISLGMPHRDDCDTVVEHPIDESIVPDKEFSRARITEFGNLPTDSRMATETGGCALQLPDECACGGR